MARNSKYLRLAEFFIKKNEDNITLTFSEIEEILGFQLSNSARIHRPLWANAKTGALSYGWMSVGYETYAVDMQNEIVNFRKVGTVIVGQNTPKEVVKRRKHTTNGIVITNEMIEEAHQLVKATSNYGPEDDLITDAFKRFPNNTDPTIVAMKIGLIDITNSTHISQHKSKISVVELAECIVRIKDIDERIKNGDPEVVNEIARCNGKINLFSFASKYCCYHNKNLYGRDDYSILDTVLKKHIPDYFDDITTNQIKMWKDSFDYESYNDYLTRKLDELNITIPFRKRKFDHFIWFNHR